ncbi:tRNA (guanosine(46)-N7)-methyltransferase TrmB [Reichenbachiella carrageenanivorans]|uniref:tRNA (guanine-N(7)-)-methyltransferase n=1 Tax=Reichenbachiella carrageenanivorans TaxID=2979869 RepID=A0ABY6CZF1_9BACT|nr:tRNA (guanosine(46)-N7)-methyltransferase TrmB [Reichenbachiella carrageenanivorans]UXX79287.1 tRNA (guanosine(46)-N7)-methyltransferase TrmB [Reichenbachiella carrageenanivorans]
MSRKKLERFKDNAERYNVVQDGKSNFGHLIGKWREEHFKNDNDLVVELGCGRGEYTVGLGEKMLDTNFVGVDIKGSRIWVGSSYAIANGLENVAFLRTQIELLDKHFGAHEIDEIWVTFPDPRPKDKDEKKRLTAPRHMDVYRKLLKENGWLKFKTDNTFLFDYTLELINEGMLKVKNLIYTHDLYNSEYMDEHFGVKTKYEKLFYDQGENIKYMKFQFA